MFKRKHLFICSFFITSLIVLTTTNTFSQAASKEVSITVSGSGKSNDDAKQSAFRSAIEQAFGAFISSKTEMLNDKIVSDQIISVSSGNIKSFSILNESQLPDGSWGVTLKVLVSVDKLTSFVQAKGIAIEINGGIFALNIKQQSLNELGEVKAVSEMVGLLHEPMQISFDYVIKSSDPKSLDADNKNWDIPLVVTATTNKNIDFSANYFIKTLAALSLSSTEVASYKSLNKAIFPVVINYKGVTKTFNLRTQRSLYILNTFSSNWEFYTRLFTVQSGLDESFGNGEGQLHIFKQPRNQNFDVLNIPITDIFINFLTSGKEAASFSWQDKRTLSDIEKMSGYKVQPRGIISRINHGGFVVDEKEGHGLVVAMIDLGKTSWRNAKKICEELVFNGYNDWRLPTKEELNLVYINTKRLGIGGFKSEYGNYWSSTYHDDSVSEKAWCQKFEFGNQELIKIENQIYVRAVRSF